MSSRSRLLLVLATVVVLAGGFVLASGAAEDETPQTPAAATTPEDQPEATSEPDEPTATTGTRTEAQETDAAPAPKPAAPRVPTLVVQDGAPRGDVRELTFDKGERVRFRVRSDVVEELHIHGYDRYVDVGPDKTTTVSFPASIEGIFEVELHGSGAQLASLRVEP